MKYIETGTYNITIHGKMMFEWDITTVKAKLFYEESLNWYLLLHKNSEDEFVVSDLLTGRRVCRSNTPKEAVDSFRSLLKTDFERIKVELPAGWKSYKHVNPKYGKPLN